MWSIWKIGLAAFGVVALGSACSTPESDRVEGTELARSVPLPSAPIAVIGQKGFYLDSDEESITLAQIGSEVGTTVAELPVDGPNADIGVLGDRLLVVGIDRPGCGDDCASADFVALIITPGGDVEHRVVLHHLDRAPDDESDGARIVASTPDRAWVDLYNAGLVEISRSGETRRAAAPRRDSTVCVIDGQLTSAFSEPTVPPSPIVTAQVLGGPIVTTPTWTQDLSAATGVDTQFHRCTPDGYTVTNALGRPVLTYRPPGGWAAARPTDVVPARGANNPGRPLVTLAADGSITVWEGDTPRFGDARLPASGPNADTLSFTADADTATRTVIACAQDGTQFRSLTAGVCTTGHY